jgi:hypothetical protein
MRKLVGILLTVFFTLPVFGQNLLSVGYDTTHQRSSITLRGSGFYHSSSLQNELSKKFLYGGFINNEIKNAAREKQDVYNTFGGELESEITYTHNKPLFNDSSNISWIARAGQSIQFGGGYTADLFDLAFYGNADKLDQRMSFTNSSAFYMNSFKAGFGLINSKTKSSIVFNAVLVNDFTKINTGNNTLFTNSSNSSTEFRADILIDQSISSTVFQGMGFSMDFDYFIPIRTEGLLNGFLQITARNLGLAYINTNQRTDIFGEYRFDGLTFDNINTVFENQNLIDEIKDSLNFSTSENGKLVALPGFFQVGKIVDNMNQKDVQLFFGVRAYINRVFRPMAYVGGQYKLNDQLKLGGQISYGGYGNFRGGIYAQYQWQQFLISLGTEDIVGALSQKSFGQSAVLRLNYLL